MPDSQARLERIGTGREALERTTGFDLAVPTFGNGMADVSLRVHQSHQCP